MKAVVLAGGFGTRLRPLTETVPKPLLPVAGRPCVDYILQALVTAGFRQIIVATSYMSDRVMKKIGDGLEYDASILYSFEAEPLGTAGAVKILEDFLDETFVVASGDVLADVNVEKLYDTHRQRGAVGTMALTRVEDTSDFGVVALDENRRIVRFQEKPAPEEAFSNLINAGIYVLEPEVLEVIPDGQLFDFSKNVFPALLEKGRPLFGVELEGLWMDIGRPQDLWRANLAVVEREGAVVEREGLTSQGQVLLAPDAQVEEDVVLEGPSYVGPGVVLSRGCRVRRSGVYEGAFLDRETEVVDSLVLDHCRVGWRSVVRNSILAGRCRVDEDVRITDSVVGEDMRVRAHSRLEGASLAPPGE